jgi:hypothetical protein
VAFRERVPASIIIVVWLDDMTIFEIGYIVFVVVVVVIAYRWLETEVSGRR